MDKVNRAINNRTKQRAKQYADSMSIKVAALQKAWKALSNYYKQIGMA